MMLFPFIVIIGAAMFVITITDLRQRNSKYMRKVLIYLPLLCFGPAFITDWMLKERYTFLPVIFTCACFFVAVFMLWKRNADEVERQRIAEQQKKLSERCEKQKTEKAGE
jgi:hypothetical protein